VISEVFTQWQSRLQNFCTQLLQNRHDAEEVVQDVFARLVGNPDRYDLSTAPETLLFRMARNRCIDARRKHTARSNAHIEPITATSPDHSDLEAALSSLPGEQREVLLLTAIDGIGYREVADILNCSIGTVAARRCAAITKLRQKLQP